MRGSSRDSSASSREALDMSVTRRSSRCTSCLRMATSRSRALASVTRSSVSMAERMEVSGFLISWATSAAKVSMASIRSDRVSVISSSERERSPISSLRLDRSGSEIALARDSVTRSAA